MKNEDDDDDKEKHQSSQLHQNQTEQMETEADGETLGGRKLPGTQTQIYKLILMTRLKTLKSLNLTIGRRPKNFSQV